MHNNINDIPQPEYIGGYRIGNITCGSFVIDCNHRILLCRPSGFPNDWTVPKGLADHGELFYWAAIRELREETGISIQDYPHIRVEIGSRPYTSKRKVIVGFVFEVDTLIEQKLFCESTFFDKVTRKQTPEIVEYLWVDIKDALHIMRPEQKFLLKGYLDKCK